MLMMMTMLQLGPLMTTVPEMVMAMDMAEMDRMGKMDEMEMELRKMQMMDDVKITAGVKITAHRSLTRSRTRTRHHPCRHQAHQPPHHCPLQHNLMVDCLTYLMAHNSCKVSPNVPLEIRLLPHHPHHQLIRL